MSSIRLLSAVTSAACLGLLFGCGGGGDRTLVPMGSRIVERDLEFGLNTAERYSADTAESSGQDSAAFAGPLEADVPPDWTAKPATRFRELSYATPGGGDVSVSKTGGSVVANINRWRGQFGLSQTTAMAIAELPRVPVGPVQGCLIELEGDFSGMGGEGVLEGAKMLGVVVPLSDGPSVFVKFVGTAEVVDAQRQNLLAMVASLRSSGRAKPPGGASNGSNATGPAGSGATGTDGADPTAAGHGAGAHGGANGQGPGGLKWSTPTGWSEATSKSSMRLVTLAPDSDPEAQCYVIVLPGDGGGLVANVNRWLGEVQAPQLDAAAVAALPTVKVFGRDATLVEGTGDYSGQNGQRKNAGLLGVICSVPQSTLFVKMVGPVDVVRAEKARFIEFCESLSL